MSFTRTFAAISFAFCIGAAHAQENGAGFTLARGEMVEVSVGESAVVVSSRGPAPEMPAGAQAGAQVMAGMTIEKPTQEIVTLPGGRDGALPPPTDAVRFSFAQVPGSDDVVLTIDNGYSRALSYRVFITYNGRRELSDVCLVPPSRIMFEHWPYEIDSIELYDLELHDWSPGDPTPCR